MRRHFGHLPDGPEDVEEDLRVRHVGGLIGSSVSGLPDNIDFSMLLAGVADQGGTSSCVGHAFATAIHLRTKIAGHEILKPSAKAIYDCARLIDSPNVLIDDGCRPRAAILGVQDYGIVAEDRWPLTEANVNEAPPLDVFQHALGAMVAAYYRIGGGDVATLVRSALSKGFVPVFAMDVDDSYQSYVGGVYQGLTGPREGSHMQAIVGCNVDSFLVANSWGSSFGVGGLARIATDFFNTPAVRDVIVLTTVPTKVS